MKKLSCSIIGCGRISKKHIEVLDRLLNNKYKIISVCDIKKERAKYIGLKLSVPHFKNINELLKYKVPDVVSVLTESGNHSKHVIQLAKYVNNIVVEKPMSLDVLSAKKMISETKKNNTNLFVVKQNRFNNPVKHLKKAIDQNRFKKIFLITTRVRWKRDQKYYDQDSWRGTKKFDGSVISNQANHHIDLMLWLNGDVKSVFAYSKKVSAKIECEDTVIAILRFKNGSLGCIEATTAVRPKDLEGSISVLGEGGSVEIGGFAVNSIKTWDFKKEKKIDATIKITSNENPPNVYGFGHKKFYENIYRSILNPKIKSIDGKEGLKSVILLDAINKSIKLNKEIKL